MQHGRVGTGHMDSQESRRPLGQSRIKKLPGELTQWRWIPSTGLKWMREETTMKTWNRAASVWPCTKVDSGDTATTARSRDTRYRPAFGNLPASPRFMPLRERPRGEITGEATSPTPCLPAMTPTGDPGTPTKSGTCIAETNCCRLPEGELLTATMGQ